MNRQFWYNDVIQQNFNLMKALWSEVETPHRSESNDASNNEARQLQITSSNKVTTEEIKGSEENKHDQSLSKTISFYIDKTKDNLNENTLDTSQITSEKSWVQAIPKMWDYVQKNSEIELDILQQKIMKVLQNDVGFKDIGIQFAIEQYKKRDINLRKCQIEKLCRFPNMLLYDPYPNFKQHKIFVLNNKMMKKINEKQKNVARKYSSVFKELFLNRIQKFFGVYDTEEVQQNIWITKIHYQYKN